jgi:hypothetical protein
LCAPAPAGLSVAWNSVASFNVATTGTCPLPIARLTAAGTRTMYMTHSRVIGAVKRCVFAVATARA